MEILSFIFGGIFRLAPKLMEMREKALDREHEQKMFDLQLKADELRSKLEIQKLETQGEIQAQLADIQALIAATKAQAKPLTKTGNGFVDFFLGMVEVANNAVRPLLTYWYCVAAYGSYKVVSLWLLIEQETPWKEAVTNLWTTNDHAVMFSIIGFWFVDRALRKREGT
jgi:hypothetical protein